MKRVIHSQVIPLRDVPQESLTHDEPRRLEVLVVDDEQLIADTLGMILSRSGYQARAVYDGRTALELARLHQPSLVITDVIMPGMTGIELALALEVLIPECKILLFSGQAATVDLLHTAREAGRDFTILSKPIHPSDMIRRVSEYVSPANRDSYAVVN